MLSSHAWWFFLLIKTIATSLVPYKSLYWCLASFTPDVMPSGIRSSMTLITDTNVITCFQHRLFNITRLQSLIHSIQLIHTHLQESTFPFFLIVHHTLRFRNMQHKVICKLLLTGVCGSPILFFFKLFIGQFGSLDFHMRVIQSKSLPSSVQHLHSYNWMKFKTHTLVYKT